tara:strand:- start:240 stop:434 length:195 start_codon:yes stop_codon:yes gene_type:complete
MIQTEKQFKNAMSQLNATDIRFILKTIFESHNIWGSDIEQSVKTINKLKTKLKEIEDSEKPQIK